MSTLEARRRVRRLIELAARRALHVAELALESRTTGPDGNGSQNIPRQVRRGRVPGELAVEGHHASTILYDRLDPETLAEIERRIREWPELAWALDGDPDLATRRYISLCFGIWLEVPGLLERTGLIGAQPPDEIHAMARGPLSAAGGLYEADMITSALSSVGVEMASVRDGLDFGCSSGRVVRVLAGAYPETSWHGCDPNAGAIDWATRSLPGINFFISDDRPPIPLGDQSLDLVCAISIWSHFEPQLGLEWFAEIHRLLRPGGHLVCTTHGLASVEHDLTNGLRTPQQSAAIGAALDRSGTWYAPEFGDAGDWGVVNSDWGTAFLTPEWLLTELLPRWQAVEFASGRNQGNQDVYVLRRV